MWWSTRGYNTFDLLLGEGLRQLLPRSGTSLGDLNVTKLEVTFSQNN